MKYPDKADIAELLLNKSGIFAPPVKLAEIVKNWDSLQVTFDEIDGDAYLVDLGILGNNILIRKNANPERQRFSLAHELGHIILKESGLPSLESTVKSRKSISERWCNEFASELLMPSGWIDRDVVGTKIDNIFTLCHKLAEKYQVSFEAMVIRISEITPVNIARLVFKNANTKVIYNKSKISPIDFDKYKFKILPEIKRCSLANGLFLDKNLYCFLHVQEIKHDEQKWFCFLTNTDESLTIGGRWSAR